MRCFSPIRGVFASAFIIWANGSMADELKEPVPVASAKTGSPKANKLHGVTIVGDSESEKSMAGSSHVVGREALQTHHQTDLQRVIWEVPGLYYQDEDGYGLRPNIGMRGVGVLRSQKITIMEDGVLVSPAPYSAPAMHSLPIAGRMEAVEIRKGSSAIEYGPFTVGGAINLKSTSIPEGPVKTHANVAVGERYGRRIHMNVGGSTAHTGWLLETYQMGEDGYRKVDGGGKNDLSVQDTVAKLRLNTDKSGDRYQEVTMKLLVSGERSSESYLGLTESDFKTNAYRLYAGAQKDTMHLARQATSLRHVIEVTPNVDVTTTVYNQTLKRNWYKLEGVKSGNSDVNLESILADTGKYAAAYGVLAGATSEANALQVRANNRRFVSQGVESVLNMSFGAQFQHDLRIGLRLHKDREDRLQQDDRYQMFQGAMSLTTAATPGAGKGNNRIGSAQAFSAYVHDVIGIGDLSLSIGARHELIDLKQEDYGATDPDRAAAPTNKSLKVSQTLPGLGLAYQLSPSLTTFMGTHRGFAPPTPGSEKETKAETSWNTEAGLRFAKNNLTSSLTGFYNIYENILGADTIASGGQGTGALYNGGKARILGAEAAVRSDLGALAHLPVRLPAFVNYTYTDARFESSFKTSFEEWSPAVNKGDYLPFIPHNTMGFGLGVAKAGYPDLNVVGHFQSRTRVKSGSAKLTDVEALPERTIFDLSTGYDYAPGQRFYVDIRNVANRTYIAARRPAGMRPGMPRTLWAGISLAL